MANYRQVHTKIWKDGWFLDLKPAHKLFFIYLFTNDCASISGIYELPKRVMSFEAGLTSKEIDAAFEVFAEARKALYQDGVVWIVNLRKYHETASPKVQTRIENDVLGIKDCELKGIYCEAYGIDTVSSDMVSIPPYKSKSKSTSSITSKSGNGGSGGKGAEPEKPDVYSEMRQEWAALFPGKPQPRADNKGLMGKVQTRLRVEHFAQNWRSAMQRATKSKFLNDGGFFDFAWFVKNDENYEKCLNGNYDNSANQLNQRPTSQSLGLDAVRRQLGGVDDNL